MYKKTASRRSKFTKQGIRRSARRYMIPPAGVVGVRAQEEEEEGTPFEGPVTLTVTVVHGSNSTPIATLPDSDSDSDSDEEGDGPTIALPRPPQTTIPVGTITSVPPTTTAITITSSISNPTSTANTASRPSSSTSSVLASPSVSVNTGTSSSADNAQDDGTTGVKLSSGAIAGIVVGCLIVLLAATMFGLRKKNTKNRLKLRGVWAGSKALRTDGGEGTGNRDLAPPPYMHEPRGDPAVMQRRRDVESAMSFGGGESASLNGGKGVRRTVSPEMLQPLPSAYGYGYGYGLGLSSAGSMPASAHNPTVAGGGMTAVVARSFIPSLPDELTISTGETLEILEEFDDGWAECMNKGEEVGMVPMECFDSPPHTSTMESLPVVENKRKSLRHTSLPSARR